MSYERRLWSRQDASFPYIVLCWSAHGILMLSWRGCRAASLCKKKKHDLGPVAPRGKPERLEKKKKRWWECPLAVHIESAFKLGSCCVERWGREMFYPPIISSGRRPSLWHPRRRPSDSVQCFLPNPTPSHTLPRSASLLIPLLFLISFLDSYLGQNKDLRVLSIPKAHTHPYCHNQWRVLV